MIVYSLAKSIEEEDAAWSHKGALWAANTGNTEGVKRKGEI